MYYEKRMINFNHDEVMAMAQSPRSEEIAKFLIDIFPQNAINDLMAGVFGNPGTLQTVVIDNIGANEFAQPGRFLSELDKSVIWFGLIEMQFDALVSLTIDEGVITSAEWLESKDSTNGIDISEFIDIYRLEG